ncbi:MAG TPA: energy transducer TonB [Pyrinomonadaceae bacterium]|nr:energy transducer TonB [Pyrinomonadaceae bacterium]
MNTNPTLLKRICDLMLLLLLGVTFAAAQDRAPKVVSQPVFNLSDEAIAAGIDGVLGVSLKIDKNGAVKNVVINGGPAWQCGSREPKDQIEAVRDAVKKQLLATTFEPPMKGGKPTEVDLSLQFAIGSAYKSAVREEEAKLEALARLVEGTRLIEAGVINGRAIRLVKPPTLPMNGVVVIRVQIDEKGNVTHAGAVTGDSQLQDRSRTAACASKFSPTSLGGSPVKVTGMITYSFHR